MTALYPRAGVNRKHCTVRRLAGVFGLDAHIFSSLERLIWDLRERLPHFLELNCGYEGQFTLRHEGAVKPVISKNPPKAVVNVYHTQHYYPN